MMKIKRIQLADLTVTLDAASGLSAGMSDTGWKFFCGLGHMLKMNDGSACGSNPYNKGDAQSTESNDYTDGE